MGVSQLHLEFDKKFVCVCVCVSQADAVIAHVMAVAGGTRKTSAKPVSIHTIYRHQLFT